MNDVFLSRPTWVDPKYEPGLDGFIRYLEIQNFTPRTIGTTDYPTNSPLDEVIELMKHCKGAIILGYPQITVQTGMLKNKEIQSPLILGTEWNHIEAALAYSLNLPLLLICDSSVSRGVFDKGTLNTFLYSKNLKDPTWFMEKDIIGALTTWSDRLSGTPSK